MPSAWGQAIITADHHFLSVFCPDKFYWTHGYVLISKEVEDCVPVFLKHIAHDVYVCGKTINLLKLCCPRVRGACCLLPVQGVEGGAVYCGRLRLSRD